jgi:hypothetical protein
MEYQGTWNASTNSPTLANGTGNAGDVYRVTAANSRDLGAGAIDFQIGDYCIYDGSVWQKADTTDAVSSVNGYTGSVTLGKSDVGLENVDNTSDSTKNSATATLTNKTLTSPKVNILYDTGGAPSISLAQTSSAVNYLQVLNAAASGNVNMNAVGSDSDIGLVLGAKGTKSVVLRNTGGGYALSTTAPASSVNYLTITGSATGVTPSLGVYGTDTDVSLNLTTRGGGTVKANNVDVVTTTGTQTLTNKTIDGSSTATQLTGTTNVANGGSLYFYNTTDQSSSYERIRANWSANVFNIYSESTSGTTRTLRLAASGSQLDLTGSTGTIIRRDSTTIASVLRVTSTSLTSSSGTQSALLVDPTVLQTGTASYAALLVNPTDSGSTSTGTKLLADFQVGGTSKTKIDNTGTHTLSSGAGLTIYNTADETTNYERVRGYWSSNNFYLQSESAGTGTTRGMWFSASTGNVGLKINNGVSSGAIQVLTTTSSTGSINLIANGTWSASSGTQYGVSISPTVIQSSTGGYTTLLVNPTESGTGSGTKLLADFQVGGTSKTKIDNTGAVTATSVSARVIPRIGTTTSTATPSIDCTLYDQYNITALALAITGVTITGTPLDGQKLLIRIKGDATPRTITWGASFTSSGVATLLGTTAASKTHLVGLVYDAAAALWVCVAVDATGY